MKLTDETKKGLGIALDESTLVGVEFDKHKEIVNAYFSVMSLPADDSPPGDARRKISLFPIGRIAASLRNGNWDDLSAKVVPFRIEELHEIVQSFHGVPIYGGNFFDLTESSFEYWSNRLSVNYQSGPKGMTNSIHLFQESLGRHLDLRIWFDELIILNAKEEQISMEDFISGGVRWWDGFYDGDKRTMGHGMMPLNSKNDLSNIVNEINKKKR